jgi:hypothetical protein
LSVSLCAFLRAVTDNNNDKTTKISIIVAATKNMVIGKDKITLEYTNRPKNFKK